MVRQVTSAIIIIIKSADMSSPTKVYQGSPILRLEDRYSSRNINAILEEERSAALARNLLLENESLNSENLRLQQGFRESRKVEAFYSKENELLKKDESELRLIIAGLRRDNEIKTREIELLTRDIGMIREHHTRDTEELREANRSLSAQNALLERKNA